MITTEMRFLLKDRVNSADIQRELRVNAPSCQMEPVQVVWTVDDEASWMFSFGGFPGTSNC